MVDGLGSGIMETLGPGKLRSYVMCQKWKGISKPLHPSLGAWVGTG